MGPDAVDPQAHVTGNGNHLGDRGVYLARTDEERDIFIEHG